MEQFASVRPHKAIIVSLVVFLVLTSVAVIYTTGQNIAAVKRLALQSLNATAFSLASSAENLVREQKRTSGRELREIFADRVVAYALIAGKDGVIQFHTNPGLIGKNLEEQSLETLFMSKKAAGLMIHLQTGQSAYEYSYIFLNQDGTPGLLRLVLYTVVVDQIVAKAQRMWWAVGIVLVLLWGLAVFVWNVLLRYLRARDDFQKRENAAMIGQMTGVLAHEIRNALAGVRGYTQWVEEKMDDSDPRKTGLTMALQGTDRIDSLVNELLLFSRDEQYIFDPVDAREIVSLALSSMTPWEGNVEIHGEASALVKADKEKLLRVLLNGIQNAIQAMGVEGNLNISLRKEGGWGVIEIYDTGPGVDKLQFPLLFTPFYTTKMNGTGLGLAYSKKVVEGMGGRISLANRHDKAGAVLTICLVRAEE
jgi:signal transduction histidine kinase